MSVVRDFVQFRFHSSREAHKTLPLRRLTSFPFALCECPSERFADRCRVVGRSQDAVRAGFVVAASSCLSLRLRGCRPDGRSLATQTKTHGGSEYYDRHDRDCAFILVLGEWLFAKVNTGALTNCRGF